MERGVEMVSGKSNMELNTNLYIYMYYQECIIRKERSRSVKCPRFNWIFFLPTRASRYTIFR